MSVCQRHPFWQIQIPSGEALRGPLLLFILTGFGLFHIEPVDGAVPWASSKTPGNLAMWPNMGRILIRGHTDINTSFQCEWLPSIQRGPGLSNLCGQAVTTYVYCIVGDSRVEGPSAAARSEVTVTTR